MARKNRERQRDEQLAESRERAEAWPGPITFESVTELATHTDPRERRLALALMQREIYERDVPAFRFFPLARRLVGDPDNICRWQGLFVISECIESHPEDVWSAVLEYGDSPDEDMRSGVACVVFEHLLEQQFELVLPKLRAALPERSPDFCDTIRMAAGWIEKDAPRFRRVQQVLRTAARGQPGRARRGP